MLYLSPKLLGKEFTTLTIDSTTVWTCAGYSKVDSEPCLIVGSTFDNPSNSTRLHTFKLSEVRFIGNVTTSLTVTA